MATSSFFTDVRLSKKECKALADVFAAKPNPVNVEANNKYKVPSGTCFKKIKAELK